MYEYFYFLSVDKRKEAVLHRRNLVKDQAAVRRNALIASRNYQAFRADVDDLKTWLTDKLKTASDESYRDLTNIERKLQKHEAFECELRANEGQLRNINKVKINIIKLFNLYNLPDYNNLFSVWSEFD